MTSLVWHRVGLGECSAWSFDDGTFAPATAKIAKTHRGYHVEIRSNQTHDDLVSLHLNHQDFTLEDAQGFAEQLIAEPLPLGDQQVDSAIVQARLRARAEPQRCRFVHVFPLLSGDDAICQCGRVTKGLLAS
jgi:hypothetical protein